MLPAKSVEGKPDDCENEWQKSLSRGFFLFATMFFLFWLESRGELGVERSVVVGMVVSATVSSAVIHYLLWRSFCPRGFKYLTVVIDHTLMSTAVYVSGGFASMFFPAYYIILFSNGARYGMGMSLYTALVFNVIYVLLLLLHPIHVPQTRVASEGVRIMFYWAAAVYIGIIASRFHRLARIVEAHEETIQSLRAGSPESA